MKKLLLVLLTLLYYQSALAQAPTIQWQKAFGGSEFEEATAIEKTVDNGFIIAGSTYSINGNVTTNQGQADYWVVKIDLNGNIQWQKTFGGTNDDAATSIKQTLDGGYIVSGYTLSNNGDVTNNRGSTDGWIVKLSNNGNLEWQKTIGGTGIDFAKDILQNTDNSYIVCGWTSSNNGDVTVNQGSFDLWIIKLSNTGNIIWQKTFGGNGSDYARNIQKTTDGGYIIAGSSNSTNGNVTGNQGEADMWIVKLSSIGNIEWQKSYGGTKGDRAHSIKQTSDGKYIVVGQTLSSNGDVVGFQGLVDAWVLKLSNSGTIDWQKTIGTVAVEYAQDVQLTSDGNYIIAGASQSQLDNAGQYTITKLTSSGAIEWQGSYNGPDDDLPHSIKQTIDGGYIIAGRSKFNLNNNSDYDFWIVKLFPEVLNNVSFENNIVKIFPNPANSSITVSTINNIDITKIQIFDITGKTIYHQSLNSNTISIEKLSKGIYLLQTSIANKELYTKFIKN